MKSYLPFEDHLREVRRAAYYQANAEMLQDRLRMMLKHESEDSPFAVTMKDMAERDLEADCEAMLARHEEEIQ